VGSLKTTITKQQRRIHRHPSSYCPIFFKSILNFLTI
jgi:hypothetical protein